MIATQFLPEYLKQEGFILVETEDFLTLYRGSDLIARFNASATNLMLVEKAGLDWLAEKKKEVNNG